ncbi:hypothetical protein H8S10_02735 [Clostridium sp. NSJ-49]|uniref:hypothetical protein n=1 Tax=Clostridium TaxID=1485 RepID=UPI00164A916E|nr:MULTISPECIES: hypothetical protein [unclassified Clostridium]MBC5624376.1 hypothetical protein [Clostridium sp. NSJ-49]MCD2501573.1 hypothetical protein [Clostridium sp. NSJ-145]
MIKRTVAIGLSTVLILGMIGCSNNKENANNDVTNIKVEAREALPGEWSQDLTREEVAELNKEILSRVEETATFYGLDYEITEEVKEDTNGLSINDNHINIDIEDPEPNRIESMYYGFKQYGTDLASGELVMKISSILDKKAIEEEGTFDFGATSFSTFSEAFTGVTGRDYSELNQQIYDMITGNNNVTTIENNLDGVRETISITDDFLLYTLQTKEYQFK